MNTKFLSIIVPVYNESEIIDTTDEKLRQVLDDCNYSYEIIYVNDGSKDESYYHLKHLSFYYDNTHLISFARNFGHQIAISAGMAAAKGDAIVIIDADLQDPPEVILDMIKLWEKGNDVVYAKRKQRQGETFVKKFTAALYYRILWAISDVRIPIDTGDFRLIDRRVNDVLSDVHERNRYMRGLVSWVGFKQCACEYVRHERAGGTTKYSMKKMIKLALDGMTSMSKYPLKIGLAIGAGIMTLSFIMMIANIFTSFTRFMDLILLMLIGLLFFYLGITGMYLGRIYDESLDRPLYIIDEEKSNYEKNIF